MDMKVTYKVEISHDSKTLVRARIAVITSKGEGVVVRQFASIRTRHYDIPEITLTHRAGHYTPEDAEALAQALTQAAEISRRWEKLYAGEPVNKERGDL